MIVFVVGYHSEPKAAVAALALALLRGHAIQSAEDAAPVETFPIKLYSQPEQAGDFLPAPRSRYLPGDPQPWKRRK